MAFRFNRPDCHGGGLAHSTGGGVMSIIMKRIGCVDGTTLSVAVKSRYDNNATMVSYIFDANGDDVTPPNYWKKYAGNKFPADKYHNVPFGLIEQFIQDHGGLK